MAKEFDRKIVFEDGSEYYGYSFGARADRVCEAVFNTSPWGIRKSCPTRRTRASSWR